MGIADFDELGFGLQRWFHRFGDRPERHWEIIDMVNANPELDLLGKDSSKARHHFTGEKISGNEGSGIYLQNLLAYGVHRSRNDSDKSSQYGFMSLFDGDQYLISPERF